MKIVHTADLHLGRFYKGELPLDISRIRRDELWESFSNTIKFCEDKNIDFLLLAGDVYEKDYFSIQDMKKFMTYCNRLNKTKVIIIAGNHDYIDDKSLYFKVNKPNNVFIFNKESYFDFEDYKLRIHGISWDVPRNLNKKFEFSINDDYKNILILHGTINSNDNDYFSINLDELKKFNFDYIALGHIHTPKKIENNCYYSGSAEGLNFKEIGTRGINYIELNDELKVEFIDKSVRKYNEIEINIDKFDLYEDIKNKIREELKDKENDLNRIILKGFSKITNDSLNLLRDDNYFYMELVNDIKNIIDIDRMYLENKNNIIGSFIESMKNDEEALNIGLRVIDEVINGN